MRIVYNTDMEKNEIQQLIEELMSRGWTETQIAARLGASQATVNRWRRGDRHPPLSGLIAAELRRMLRSKGVARMF